MSIPSLARTLKHLRIESGKSVLEAAAQSGVGHNSIYLYEIGKREPKLPCLQALLNTYGYKLDIVKI